MCGIFGILGSLPPTVLDGVSAALAHRGPDEEGRLAADGVTLVHRRLRIIDLSPAAAQPLGNEDGTVCVVFNGEIYNHRALHAELERLGHRFRSHTDTEVIVHGYEQWGDEVVERLDGMFAFGLWDRARSRLLLSRDRAGKKPLFFTDGSGPFRFGSTVHALHVSGLPKEVALDRVPYYLAYGYAPGSLYAGVRELSPGTRLVVERGQRPQISTYWSPRFVEAHPAPSFAQACEAVRRLVVSAVERRLESDVPLGALLSGGVDSSIVVGVMQQKLGRRVRTFSIGFAGDARYDETHYARMAAQAYQTEHVEFTLDPTSFDLVETLVRHHDGPFGDASAIPTYVVCGLTRQHVTVALTGDGGDELFCGYPRFLAAEAAEQIPIELRRLANGALRFLPGRSGERSLSARAHRFVSASTMPLAERMARWNSYFDPHELLRADVARALGGHLDAPLNWQRRLFAQGEGLSVVSRVLEHNFRTYLPYDLLIKADRCSMAHGLELRAPFLDTALTEYASSLPAAHLRQGRLTKRVLKQAFADLLPAAIRTRPKMGFGVPLGTWFRGGLRDYLNDRLGPSAHIYDLLDRAVVARYLREHAQGFADHGLRLWALLTLEVWLAGGVSMAAAITEPEVRGAIPSSAAR